MSLFSTEELAAAKAQAIQLAKMEILTRLDPEDLITLELDEAARYLRVSNKTASRLLPVMELGPRMHRVELRAFQNLKHLATTPPNAGALAAYLRKYGALPSTRPGS